MKTCPICGHILVIRQGAGGRFWGCNNYPECDYTEDIEGEPYDRDCDDCYDYYEYYDDDGGDK